MKLSIAFLTLMFGLSCARLKPAGRLSFVGLSESQENILRDDFKQLKGLPGVMRVGEDSLSWWDYLDSKVGTIKLMQRACRGKQVACVYYGLTGVVHLRAQYFDLPAPLRLSILLHEAFHLHHPNEQHQACTHAELIGHTCDNKLDSAYGLEVRFLHAWIQNHCLQKDSQICKSYRESLSQVVKRVVFDPVVQTL